MSLTGQEWNEWKVGQGGISRAAQAAEQSFMALLLLTSGSTHDFLSIPLMGLVKRAVLADGAINADVLCVVNYFTGRGEHFPGTGVAGLRQTV